MSLEQHAFLLKSRVPTRDDWQAAIDGLGFDFQIDPALKPFEASGFVPCKIEGKDSGFEVYYEPAADVVDAYRVARESIAARDFSISFRWGGHMAECACVLIASAGLAKSFDAVVYDPQDEQFYSIDELLREARQILQNCLEEPEFPRPHRSLLHRLAQTFIRRRLD